MEERMMKVVEVCAENGTLGWVVAVGLVAVCLCTIMRVLHADSVHERECRLRQLELEKAKSDDT